MNGQRSEMKWRLISNEVMHLRCWDDEFVVFNRNSGDTHLLGTAAVHLLTSLKRGPTDATDLTAELCRMWQIDPDHDPDHELALQVEDILTDLQQLAMIEEVA